MTEFDKETSFASVLRVSAEDSMLSLSSVGSAFDFDDTATTLPPTATPADKEAFLRDLVNKLDKAYLKLHESLAVNRTYQVMQARVLALCADDPRVATSIERELSNVTRACRRAAEEMHDVVHTRDEAKHALASAAATADEGRREWTTLLRLRRDRLNELKKLRENAETRLLHSEELLAKATGDLTRAEEEKARAKAAARSLEGARAHDAKTASEREVERIKELFEKVRSVTGRDELEEIVASVVDGEFMAKRLQANIAKLRDGVEQRRRALAAAESELMEARLHTAGFAMARQKVDIVDDELGNVQRLLRDARARCEEKTAALVHAKIGIEGILSRIQTVSGIQGYRPPDAEDGDSVAASEAVHDVEILFKLLESRVAHLVEAVESMPASATADTTVQAGGGIPWYSPSRLWGDTREVGEGDDDGDLGDDGNLDDDGDGHALSRKEVKGNA